MAVPLKRTDFQKITGEADFPDYLKPFVQGETLHYWCNTCVDYRLRGIWVQMRVLWDLEAATGAGDTHLAVFRGTHSAVEVRQGADQGYRPELYVLPNEAADRAGVGTALERKMAALQARFPGIAVRERGLSFHVTIPDSYRVGHEAHFRRSLSNSCAICKTRKLCRPGRRRTCWPSISSPRRALPRPSRVFRGKKLFQKTLLASRRACPGGINPPARQVVEIVSDASSYSATLARTRTFSGDRPSLLQRKIWAIRVECSGTEPCGLV